MACVTRCPTGAIQGGRALRHSIDPQRCIDCGVCGCVCPDEAVEDNHGTLCGALRVATSARAYVDLTVCTGCGDCVWSCPFDALQGSTAVLPSGANVYFAAVHDGACVACGLCELACSDDAIRVYRPHESAAVEVLARNKGFVYAERGEST